MKPPFLICINQHPSFPCQLVEKSLWPEEPKYIDRIPEEGQRPFVVVGADEEYERQKLSALQAGAVVEDQDSKILICEKLNAGVIGVNKELNLIGFNFTAGVYELDPSRWAVEIRWQAKWYRVADEPKWVDVTDEYYEYGLKDPNAEFRKIAIISPVETPKETEDCEKKCGRDECVFKCAYPRVISKTECCAKGGDLTGLFNCDRGECIHADLRNSPVEQEEKKVEAPTAEQYLDKIKEVCIHVSGNLLEMPSAIRAIQALVDEFKTNKL